MKCVILILLAIFSGFLNANCTRSVQSTHMPTSTPVSLKVGNVDGVTVYVETDQQINRSFVNSEIDDISLGKLWLISKGPNEQATTRTEVPSNALAMMNPYLKLYLRSCLNKPESAQEGLEQDMQISKASNNLSNQLLDVKIESREGARNLLANETDALIEFVGKAATDICDERK